MTAMPLDSRWKPLEAAEGHQDIFAVIGDGRSLKIGANTLDFLLDGPGFGIHDHDAAGSRCRMQDREIEL